MNERPQSIGMSPTKFEETPLRHVSVIFFDFVIITKRMAITRAASVDSPNADLRAQYPVAPHFLRTRNNILC